MFDPDTIRCLTLHQPWATLIAEGAKRYETRSWPTDFRGYLAIHAGQTVDRDFAGASGVRNALWQMDPNTHPVGKIIAVGKLVAVHRTEDIFDPADLFEPDRRPKAAPEWDTSTERMFGDFSAGRFAWEIRGVVTWNYQEPRLKCRGYQGLWKPPVEHLDELADICQTVDVAIEKQWEFAYREGMET